MKLQQNTDMEATAKAIVRLGKILAAVLTTKEPAKLGVVDDDGKRRTFLITVQDITPPPPPACPNNPAGGPCEAVAGEPWRCIYGAAHFMPGVLELGGVPNGNA